MKELSKHKKYFYFFLILSVLGLLDIGTRELIAGKYNLSDTGIVSFYLGKTSFFSSTLSAIIVVVSSFIFSFTILWIIIAIIEYLKIRKLKKSS